MADVASPKSIPLVNNIIHRSSFNHFNLKEKSVLTVEATLKLLTCRHSEKLINRHVRSINLLTQQFKKGFMIADIPVLGHLIAVCASRVENDLSYEKPLCEILKVCSNPFLKEKSSDESNHFSSVVEFMREVGNVMLVKNAAIHTQIAQSLTKFYCSKDNHIVYTGMEPTKPDFNRLVIERSGVVRSVVKCLETCKNLDVRMELMVALQCFSTSAVNCDDMLYSHAARIVCSSLGDTRQLGRGIFLCVDILWNMLDNGSKSDVAQQLHCLDCIRTLYDAFVYLVTKGFSQSDKQLRNDILVMALLIADSRPTAPFVETGFTKFLVLCATLTEVKTRNLLVRDFKFEQCREDFELKKLLISAMVTMSKDPTAVQIMSSNRLLLSLFTYIKASDSLLLDLWSPSQTEELQLESLSALCSIAPLCINDYLTCQGNNRLLLLLEWCIGQGDYGGHGNSYHAEGGRGNKRAQMRYCLRLLRSMSSTEDDAILQDLSDQGAIGQLTGILWNASTSCDENDNIDIEMQCDMLLILSCLCEGDVHRKELFACSGVDMIVEFLKKDLVKVHSPLGDHALFLAAVECVWSSVLGCDMSEQKFLEKQGIFLLLDLLEGSPSTIQGVVLGCLVDLCENPKALSHVYSWRGKSNITTGKLLIDLWRTDEISLGVARTQQWLIKNLSQPLMGKVQRDSGSSNPLPANVASPAVVEVSESIRANIYTIFSKLGFNDIAGLSTMDYVTLAIIENYLEFKVFEVWQEISDELERENFCPVSPDLECLKEINRMFEERTASIISSQEELVENQTQQDLTEEQACYDKIVENHEQREKAFNDFCDFLNRTSDYAVLKASKKKQLADIDSSRLYTSNEETEDEVLTTLQSNVTTTTFCGRLVDMTSDAIDKSLEFT
ncbi:cilia- and flagella-associated protein 69-like [Xenia sp. Carnegie-2017]|uniref:cilia- and flagella-associated protein 69-like n=1 Tax=Xenia sp. Carnegie-2017 TaxID=2897299 RepID=UPI001F04C65C|nr:cilia- and flagella-associated protein 69-like [Xenia sp. Carnegie-2017]